MIKKLFFILLLFTSAQSSFGICKEDINLEFFNRFNDDCLVYYITQAFNNNHELKQTSAKVEQYRQQAKYSFGKELPSLSVSPSYLGVHVPRFDNFQLNNNAFVLPFIANYEADFLLKNRDKTKSALKNYEAVKYEEKAVYLALLSDVASVYTNILQYDFLLKNQKQDIEIRRILLSANEKKYKRGIIDINQLNNSKKELETSKNKYEELKKEQKTLLMQLAVLCALEPECADNMQRGTLNTMEYNLNIPEEISSDVIFARPDVMQAEKTLEKAKIDARIAKKEFFPSFNITGIWAFNTIAPGNFFSWESSLAAILAGATQDIFQGGRKISNLKIQKSKYEELFENYCQTNLNAVKEVNTALYIAKHDLKIKENTQNKLEYETSNFENALKKMNNGVISNPDYLEEKINLINTENEAANAKTQRIVNYYTLYKAVGGQL